MAEVKLPVELITEILTRLPAKPLFGFKCVSKSWNSLISSPSFITLHLKSNANLNVIFTPCKSDQPFFSALIYDDINNSNTEFHFSEFKHPFEFKDSYAFVMESSNGILLVSDSTNKTFFLYNPVNNTYRLIPSIPSRNQECFGFGYDSHTDDYRMLRVVQNRGVNLEMYVYSMRENVWKFIKDESSAVQKYVLHQGSGVFANGVVYFSAGDSFPVVLCFDFRTESVSILDYPQFKSDSDSDVHSVSTSLSKLSGWMSLILNYHSFSGDIIYADVWEFREASWVKLFKVKNNELVGKGEPPCTSIRLVAYSKDKGKVLVHVGGDCFGWYDLVTKRLKKVKTHGLLGEFSTYVLTTYVESLILLGNVKAVSATVSKGVSTPKKTDCTKKDGFLSKGFKLRL